MQSLRRHRHLARPLAVWLLLWFVSMAASAYLGAAESDPAGGGSHHAQHLQQGDAHEDCDDGDTLADAGHATHAVHCPLCLHAAAPPSVAIALPGSPLPSAPLLAGRQAPAPKVRTAAPPPARGPPTLS